MRVIFMGTPIFAIPALQALIGSSHTVVAVYSQPPRPAGRGMRMAPSPIQQLAEEHGIPVFTPASLKSPEVQAEFAAHRADIAVVAAYGLLLPKPILDAPRLGCINIHPSDLPRWRGAAPIQRTLMEGDHRTACCIMQMEAGLDTGPILARTPLIVTPMMDYGQLHHILGETGASQILEVLARLASGTLTATPQSTEGVTYAEKLIKADRILRWHHPAEQLFNQIRGLSPNPAAYAVILGEMVKIFASTVEVGNPNKAPGVVLDRDFLVNAGNGMALRITEVQRPNKTRASASECLQGFPIPPGTMLEGPIP
jgi:methionyl-tRNA formyltransferase